MGKGKEKQQETRKDIMIVKNMLEENLQVLYIRDMPMFTTFSYSHFNEKQNCFRLLNKTEITNKIQWTSVAFFLKTHTV